MNRQQLPQQLPQTQDTKEALNDWQESKRNKKASSAMRKRRRNRHNIWQAA